MDIDKRTRGDLIIAVLAVVLVLDLILAPWLRRTTGAGGVVIYTNLRATSTPNSLLGVVAILATLALLVDLAIEHASPQTKLPALRSRATNRLALAIAAAACIALKFLLHVSFKEFRVGAYVAVVVAALLVLATLRARASEEYGTEGERVEAAKVKAEEEAEAKEAEAEEGEGKESEGEESEAEDEEGEGSEDGKPERKESEGSESKERNGEESERDREESDTPEGSQRDDGESEEGGEPNSSESEGSESEGSKR